MHHDVVGRGVAAPDIVNRTVADGDGGTENGGSVEFGPAVEKAMATTSVEESEEKGEDPEAQRDPGEESPTWLPQRRQKYRKCCSEAHAERNAMEQRTNERPHERLPPRHTNGFMEFAPLDEIA